MDRFYVQNAALYNKFVSSLDSTQPAPHFSRHQAGPPVSTEDDTVQEHPQNNPDMVVAARIRPMLDDDLAAGFPCAVYPRADGRPTVDLHDLYNHPRGRPILKSYTHQVDTLFDADATTEMIYADIAAELVAFAQQGGIGTLFAYGQTGSGKTFTISQLQRLAAMSLLTRGEGSSGDDADERDVYISIFDLAGNAACDLLAARKPISVLEDAAGNTQVAGVTEHRVSATDEMLDLLTQAAAYRSTASTAKNDASSRSHCICRIRIKNSISNGDAGILYLVDLAGSEAARDVATHGADRMRETREINMSLSVLKDCVRGKAEAETLKMSGPARRQKKVHVPIRQSTLTKVLKHVFDPNQGSKKCKTVVIACVNPCLADVGASRNTLRYAEMLRTPMTGSTAGRP